MPVPAALASTASVGPLRRSDVPLSAVDFHVSDVVPQLLSRADVAAAVARRLLAKRAARSAAAAAAAPEGPEREEKRAAAAAALAEVEAMSDEAVAAQLTMMAPEDAEDGIKSAMWVRQDKEQGWHTACKAYASIERGLRPALDVGISAFAMQAGHGMSTVFSKRFMQAR